MWTNIRIVKSGSKVLTSFVFLGLVAPAAEETQQAAEGSRAVIPEGTQQRTNRAGL